MPRPSKGARLYCRKRKGRESIWVVRDGAREIVVARGDGSGGEAEKALARYLAGKHDAPRAGDPARVPLADVLTLYMERHGPATARPELIAHCVTPLLAFFGEDNASAVTGASCRAYVVWRTAQPRPQFKDQAAAPRIQSGTARRELSTLAAALAFAHKEGALDRHIPVTLPAIGEGRLRWLTRAEAARLLAGAIGFVLAPCCDLKTRRPRLTIWRRDRARIHRHAARFILLGLYTGTRHDALLRLRWTPSVDSGWIDLDHGLIYRRGDDERRTAKRRPPVPIAPKLAPHLRRARKDTATHVIEWESAPIAKERKAWASARDLAGLSADVTPHVLRHTCATWMLQAGVDLWKVAGVLGASEDMIRRVYGHHAADYLRDAVRAI